MGRRRNLAVGTGIGVATVVALGTALWRTSDLGRASGELEAQRAAARREGLPMEYADLHRLTPPVAYEDNAAVAYARGFAGVEASKALRKLKVRDLLPKVEAGMATTEETAALRRALVEVGPSLDAIVEGTRRKGYSFDRPWEKGTALLFPEFAFAKHAAQALTLRALTAKAPADAARDLRAAARLGSDVGSEPTIIALLVGSATEAIVQGGVRSLGARGGAWTPAMREVSDGLAPVPDLRRALAGEAVFGRKFIDELARVKPGEMSSLIGGEDYKPSFALRMVRFRPVRDAFEARTLEHWRAVWAALPKDPTDVRAARAATSIPLPTGPSADLLGITTPVFSGASEVPARMEAERRLTRAALDLWSGRAPKLAPDPFGKGPLRLKRSGKGWTLWSVGPDGRDDDATPQKDAHGGGYDLVVGSSIQ